MSEAAMAAAIPAAMSLFSQMQGQQNGQQPLPQPPPMPMAQKDDMGGVIASNLVARKPLTESWPQNMSMQDWVQLLEALRRT